MAKIKLGPVVAQASGSIAGTVFSRNRFGTYIRTRAIPTNSPSEFKDTIKEQFTLNSRAFAQLDADDRMAWRTWAANNPFTDVLGATQNLTGHQAYCKLNGVILQCAGTAISVPPAIPGPGGLLTVTLTALTGAAGLGLDFTATPLAAGLALYVRAALTDSAGITYVRNLLKLVMVSETALAVPIVLNTGFEARFGPVAVGNYVHVSVRVVDTITGLVSLPINTSKVVTAPV